MFGVITLKDSTPTGQSRTKDESGKYVPKKKLDSTKMNAICGIQLLNTLIIKYISFLDKVVYRNQF